MNKPIPPSVFTREVHEVHLLNISVHIAHLLGIDAEKVFDRFYFQYVSNRGYFAPFDVHVKDPIVMRAGYNYAFKEIDEAVNDFLLESGLTVGAKVTMLYSGQKPVEKAFQEQLEHARLAHRV